MTANVHVHLHVADLGASRDFYRRFLGAEPVKDLPDYVKFLPPQAPLNLSLTTGANSAFRGHFGLQLGSSADVGRELDRVVKAGLSPRVEMGVNCCNANQDKFWVLDPDGHEWEVYHLNFDLAPSAPPEGTSCCSP
jgi:catechol 2,3-dioxygenase-like lactoylglutathione lyase family enzyme